METDITKHPAFLNCDGKLIAQLIGGSTLYDLNTPTSDIDYRGIFIAQNKTYVTGFDTIESIVQTGEIDSTYYELSRYLKLLSKSNTQVAEIIFAPDSAFTYTTPLFKKIRDNRYNLIDSSVLKNSLKGYVFSEIRLATGQRSGQLGGKRKLSLEKYGFSPKNFTQILRLCKVGIIFFDTGEYIVKISDIDIAYHSLLMEIKTQPQNFTCDQLEKIVNTEFLKLEESIKNSKINFKFDTNLAADIIIEARRQL